MVFKQINKEYRGFKLSIKKSKYVGFLAGVCSKNVFAPITDCVGYSNKICPNCFCCPECCKCSDYFR